MSIPGLITQVFSGLNASKVDINNTNFVSKNNWQFQKHAQTCQQLVEGDMLARSSEVFRMLSVEPKISLVTAG